MKKFTKKDFFTVSTWHGFLCGLIPMMVWEFTPMILEFIYPDYSPVYINFYHVILYPFVGLLAVPAYKYNVNRAIANKKDKSAPFSLYERLCNSSTLYYPLLISISMMPLFSYLAYYKYPTPKLNIRLENLISSKTASPVNKAIESED